VKVFSYVRVSRAREDMVRQEVQRDKSGLLLLPSWSAHLLANSSGSRT